MRSFPAYSLFDLKVEKHNNEEMGKSVGPSYGLAPSYKGMVPALSLETKRKTML
jgi:hypothetical protein